MPHLIAFGAAHLDRIAKLDDEPVAASVPGRVTTFAGGAALNAVRHISAAGHRIVLHTPGPVEEIEASGLPLGLELRALATTSEEAPSYTAVLDPSGELVVAVSDMRRYDSLDASALAGIDLSLADHVLVDANLPSAVLIAIAGVLPAAAQLYAMAVSPAKIEWLAPILDRIDILFASRREAEVLCGAGHDLGELSVCLAFKGRAALVTDGPNGLAFATGDHAEIRSVEKVQPVDVTGAGDAITGGFLSAHLAGSELDECLDAALRAARAVLTIEGPYPSNEMAFR